MNFTLEDMELAWAEGHARANWEEDGLGYEPPENFPKFMYKHFPSVTHYQWSMRYRIDGEGSELEEVIVTGDEQEARKQGYQMLVKKGLYPQYVQITKVKLTTGPLLWPCDHPQVDVCQYNLDTDPMMDDCVFCHQPLERK